MSVVPLEPAVLAQQLVALGIECKRDPMAVTRVHTALDNIGIPNEQYALSRALKELAGRPVEGEDEEDEDADQPSSPTEPAQKPKPTQPSKGEPEDTRREATA